MKIWMIRLMVALLLPACVVRGQTGESEKVEPDSLPKFAGVWRGQTDNLPAVDIVITDEGGDGLHGAILFYFHFRPDVNAPWTSKPGLPEPLFNMRVEGEMLRFEVSHRHAHPPRTLKDPPVPFRLKLIGPDRVEIVNDNERNGPPLILTKSAY